MATITEIRDQVGAQIEEVKTSLSNALDRVAADVEALKSQSDIDPSAFDSVTQGLDEVKSSLDALDPVPDAVEEPTPEEPAPEEPGDEPQVEHR